jgi:C-terminal processing protease CtpA/Prc
MRAIRTLAAISAFFISLGNALIIQAQLQEEEGGKVLSIEGFEAVEVGKTPSEWSAPVPAYRAVVVADDAAVGEKAVQVAPVAERTDAPFGNFLRQLDAGPYAGKRVKVSAKVKALERGQAQMWLRADRENGEMGAFDNMQDRPVLVGEWTTAVIEKDIEPDASRLNIGFMALGGATVLVDEVEIRVMGDAAPILMQPESPSKPLSDRGLANVVAAARALALVRFFVASDQAVGVKSWDHVAVTLMEQTEPAKDAEELAAAIEGVLKPLAPTMSVWAGSPENPPREPEKKDSSVPTIVRSWRHLGAGAIARQSGMKGIYSSNVQSKRLSSKKDSEQDVDNFRVKELGDGVCCRVPVRVLADTEGTIPHGETPEEWANAQNLARLTPLNRFTRLAGVASAWGIFQHFYPYFDAIDCDWDAALLAGLRQASEATDEIAYLHTLQELIAKLQDGHGNVMRQDTRGRSIFPLLLAWAGDELVVIQKMQGVPDEVAVGDVVESIDGRTAKKCYADVSQRISAATEGWRRSAATNQMAIFMKTSEMPSVVLRRPKQDGTLGDPFTVQLQRVGAMPANFSALKRPDNGTELAPGIVYFNLDGANSDALKAAMPVLDRAQGIVFDVRGYPGDAALDVIRRLIDEPVQSARWNIPIVTLPDREGWKWNETGRWLIEPLAPRWAKPVVFMTDGRAISYAESVMGIIEHYHLGEIVGSTTAGTNGNVNPFMLPGNYVIYWTGMKVLKHDGSQHHGIGILPTVPIEPTAAGIAAGRDEVLEKAIEVVKQTLQTKKD